MRGWGGRQGGHVEAGVGRARCLQWEGTGWTEGATGGPWEGVPKWIEQCSEVMATKEARRVARGVAGRVSSHDGRVSSHDGRAQL